ncbi:unnamed protein product [Rotaria sp. Silwood1]|nr:unnamed protein product [Rotaria sp. Silwood1]
MQSIILISLLILAVTVFSIPPVNNAPSNSKHDVASMTSSRRTTTSKSHGTRPQQTTTLEKKSPVRTTHSTAHSTSQTTKRITARPTSKVTTTRQTTKRPIVRGKRSDMKAGKKQYRQKRLSQWDWA